MSSTEDDYDFSDWTEEDRQALEDTLDEQWDNLSDEEQQEILDEYDADSWDDLTLEQKAAALNWEPDDGDDEEEDDGPIYDEDDYNVDLDVDRLAVENELEQVGESEVTVTVAGIEIPGAYEIVMAGEGYESQYLREIDIGGGSDGSSTGYEENLEGGDSGNSEEGGGDDEGEEPPLHIEILATMSFETAQELVALRERNETFEVTVLDDAYEEMELHDFTRELTGQRPYAFDTRIEVVEWRPAEIEESEDGEDGESSTGYEDNLGDEDGDSEEAADEEDEVEGAEDMPNGGGPASPMSLEMGPGEQRDFTLGDGEETSNAIFDTSEEGAGATLNPRGDGWRATDLAWDAEENRSMIDARGSGIIRNIYMGHWGDSGIVVEDGTRVDVSEVNLQHSQNGIHVVSHDVDQLAERNKELGGVDGQVAGADAGEVVTGLLEWTPAESGTYEVSVVTDDDRASITVDVDPRDGAHIHVPPVNISAAAGVADVTAVDMGAVRVGAGEAAATVTVGSVSVFADVPSGYGVNYGQAYGKRATVGYEVNYGRKYGGRSE